MTSTPTLKPLKNKLQYACSLIALQTQTYDTSVLLAFKFFTRTLVLAFKSTNTVFVAESVFCISQYITSTVLFVLKLLNFKRNLLLDF